jgi:4-amino-4-deoxy-L-arabinose transferase-like glycosyltransferase
MDARKFLAERRTRALLLMLMLALAFAVRLLTAQFIDGGADDPSLRYRGIYQTFSEQAERILDGQDSLFSTAAPDTRYAAIYPPGFPVWMALVFRLSHDRTARTLQFVQLTLDALAVLLIVGIGLTAYGWSAALTAGFLAALSPLLALYGATPLADAPASWVVLCGVWMLLLAYKRQSFRWALCTGAMLGASCWFRANGTFLAVCWALCLWLLIRASWRKRAGLSLALMLGACVLIAPLLIRNVIIFRTFAPLGVGFGTALWEGIGETRRGNEFGAVYGDKLLVAQERAGLNLAPDATVRLYVPDGVRRDRARTRKAVAVIASHPFWYLGVMAGRAWGVLDYWGSQPSYVYGHAGTKVTGARCLSAEQQGSVLSRFVDELGFIQDLLRLFALPLMLCGAALALRRDKFMTGMILSTVLYYLLVGSTMHTEVRYGLPMQALLLVFAGLALAVAGNTIRAFVQCRMKHTG